MNQTRSRVDAFFKGHTPTIACFNKATVPMGVDFDALIEAMQRFIDEHVAPIWGTWAKLVRTEGYVHGCWAIVFLDHAEHAHGLAFHDLTPEGYPQSKVFVKTTLAHKQAVSVVASHELVEMLVDPCINLVTMRPRSKRVYGYEAADPVEDLSFPVNGIPMTNFVYPAYFESFHKPGTVQFDHLKEIRRPFQIHKGGYQGIYEDGKWRQEFGSHPKRQRVEKEDRRGRRHEKRAKPVLKLSSRKHMPPKKK